MLKKIIFIFILSGGYFITTQAQVVHKPAELADILKNSKITYTQGELYIDIPDKDYSNLLNVSGIYNEDSGGITIQKKVVLPKEAHTEWYAGERALNDENDYKEARKHYKNVLDIAPDYYPAKMQIAKTFEKEENYEKAEASYKQAISKNYIDYMPHWLIAEVYLKDKKIDDAINEITLAAILNRNDTLIQADLNEIYADAKLKYSDWQFTPQCKVFKGQKPNNIEVLSQKNWGGYAAGKAIWAYEPGYAESQGEKPGRPSLLEEKECLLNLLAGLTEKIDDEQDPELSNLQDAKEDKLIDGFVYYEILLPQQPSLVYQLPNNVIKGIKNYVLMAHGGVTPR